MIWLHHRSMMTQQLGFSVLSAPLAAIDRRALSQAWYSALHVAGKKRRATTDAPKEVLQLCFEHSHARDVGDSKPMPPRAENGVNRPDLSPRGQIGEADRRAVRSSLARKIEKAFLHPTRRAARVTFSLGSGARVHVTLQQAPSGLRLVAVCAPALREHVARALEQARFALAQRGIALHASVSRSTAC